MTTRERRKSPRVNRHLTAQIVHSGSSFAAQGVTENISEEGAFIKTEDWRAFKVNDQTEVTFLMPPILTGQDEMIGLQGSAIITRIDEENEGVAVQLEKSFRQLDKIHNPEVAGKTRYKKISYFLSLISNTQVSEFVSSHPNGVLIEESQRALDDSVVFKFSTESLHDEYSMRQWKHGAKNAGVLEARVLEIKKKGLETASNTITIGRAPVNDIVIYNQLVSKSHAYLLVHPLGVPCYLMDLGSKNGTMVNGKTLMPHEKHRLKERDEITFGPQTKVVYFPSAGFHKFLNQLRTPHFP